MEYVTTALTVLGGIVAAVTALDKAGLLDKWAADTDWFSPETEDRILANIRLFISGFSLLRGIK